MNKVKCWMYIDFSETDDGSWNWSEEKINPQLSRRLRELFDLTSGQAQNLWTESLMAYEDVPVILSAEQIGNMHIRQTIDAAAGDENKNVVIRLSHFEILDDVFLDLSK